MAVAQPQYPCRAILLPSDAKSPARIEKDLEQARALCRHLEGIYRKEGDALDGTTLIDKHVSSLQTPDQEMTEEDDSKTQNDVSECSKFHTTS